MKPYVLRSGRFWVVLYYNPEDEALVKSSLQPWNRWGTFTGSATGFGCDSDISWGYPSRVKAREKAKEMCSILKLARVKHKVKVVDTNE